jgi:Ni/Co efflux regulator RcnB
MYEDFKMWKKNNIFLIVGLLLLSGSIINNPISVAAKYNTIQKQEDRKKNQNKDKDRNQNRNKDNNGNRDKGKTKDKNQEKNKNESKNEGQYEKIDKKSQISVKEFHKKIIKLGFSDDGFYFEKGKLMGVISIDRDGMRFVIHNNSSKFNKVIKKCFQMVLPKSATKLYKMVVDPSKMQDKTLFMDSREVILIKYPENIEIDIYGIGGSLWR